MPPKGCSGIDGRLKRLQKFSQVEGPDATCYGGSHEVSFVITRLECIACPYFYETDNSVSEERQVEKGKEQKGLTSTRQSRDSIPRRGFHCNFTAPHLDDAVAAAAAAAGCCSACRIAH